MRAAPSPPRMTCTASRALAEGRLLRPVTFEALTSLQHEFTPRRADGIARGWGWSWGFGVSGMDEGRLIGHTGGVPGVAAAALRVRVAEGRLVVVLSPQDCVDPPAGSALLAVDPAADAVCPNL